MSNLDRNFILNPRQWPNLVLPLTRSSAFDDGNMAVLAPPLNVMKIAEDSPIEILIGNMFDDLSKLPRRKYENVDALLADGWRVD